MNAPRERPLLALAVLVLGNVAATLFMRNLGLGLESIADRNALSLARFFYAFFQFASVWIAPVILVLLVYLVVRIWMRKPVHLGIDILGGLLSFRCALVFVVLNLLLLSELRAGTLLLIQLILFLPVITLNFGWLYWRLDSGARAAGGKQIKFQEEDDCPQPFDYFYIATRTLLQFEPSGATACTRVMKTLFVLHGIMMLDLVALTLSRAIALASGG